MSDGQGRLLTGRGRDLNAMQGGGGPRWVNYLEFFFINYQKKFIVIYFVIFDKFFRRLMLPE